MNTFDNREMRDEIFEYFASSCRIPYSERSRS